jgi:hypothetical protein
VRDLCRHTSARCACPAASGDQRMASHTSPESRHTIVQPWLFDAGGHVPNMNRETLKEKIAVRLRALFPYYTSPGKDDTFYMVRDADLTRAAESIADFWDDEDPQE